MKTLGQLQGPTKVLMAGVNSNKPRKSLKALGEEFGEFFDIRNMQTQK